MATDLPARIAALRAATKAMTPGPWRVGAGIGDPFYACPHDIVARHAPGDDESTDDEWIVAQMNGNFPERGPVDALGIVALRNDALPILDALLAEVQAARAEAVACREVAHAALDRLDVAADAIDGEGFVDDEELAEERATPDPAAAQAALDRLRDAAYEEGYDVRDASRDGESYPTNPEKARTCDEAYRAVARLLGLPEVAR